MNGLVTHLKKVNKIADFLLIYASSAFVRVDRSPVETLFDRNETRPFQFSNDKIGEFFEIHLLRNTFISLKGYGFMSPKDDSFKPRNWNVSCMSTNPPTLLANEVNNDALCQGKEKTICEFNDKKIFYTNIYIKCSEIRFTTTGPVSGQTTRYQFSLSGIELFGHYYSSRNHQTCLMKSSHFFQFIYIFAIS